MTAMAGLVPTWAVPIALPAMLLVTSLGPGLLVVRRLRWNPLEKLCGAVGASLFLTYLFALTRFVLQLPPWTHLAFNIACAACFVLALPDLRRLLRARRVRRTLLAQALLLAWVLLLLALPRHYSGALWTFDWHWHYDQAVFFLRSPPPQPSAGSSLLARPPALNLIWSHVMAHAGTRFDTFQVTCACIATLALLPCCLLAPALLRRGRPRPRGRPNPLLIAILLAVCPQFVQNATYTWTKVPSVFCAVLAIALYLKAMRRRDDAIRLAFAFAFLAFGCLVHFTAVPYGVFLLLHYFVRRRWRSAAWWRQTAFAGVVGAGVLATWYGWTVVRFGVDANLASNPSVRAASKAPLENNVARAARNAVGTLVPHFVRDVGTWFAQPNRLGYVRDHAFLVYTGNLFGAVGSVAGVLAAYLLWRLLAPARQSRASPLCFAAGVAVAVGMMYLPPARNVLVHALPRPALLAGGLLAIAAALGSLCRNVHARAAFTPDQRFWRGLIICAFVVSIAAWDAASDLGIAHVCLQPLAYMGVTLIAAHLPAMPTWFRALALLGMTIDFLLGILLHFHLQHHTFGPGNDPGLIQQARLNWEEKQAAGLTFVGDHLAGTAAAVIELLLIAGAAVMVWYVVRARSHRRDEAAAPASHLATRS